MSWNPDQKRSDAVKAAHRKRFPPRYCAGCGASKATGIKLIQDHIVNLAAGGIDCVANLQWLCETCHKPKTEREKAAGKARAQARRGSLSKRYRDIEPQPGRLKP